MTEKRTCGHCQECCVRLPVRELHKGANERCTHQRDRKFGCAIYKGRPPSCKIWSCGWLLNGPYSEELRRPDVCHYTIDPTPDFIRHVDHVTGTETRFPVIQIWVDPKYPDAHRDPALRAYLEKLAALSGYAAIVRFDARRALTLFAPHFCEDGVWHEVRGICGSETHSAVEVVTELRNMGRA